MIKKGNRGIIKPEKGKKKKTGKRMITLSRRGPAVSAWTPSWRPAGPAVAQPWPLPSCPSGCGGGWRRKLHDALLHSAGRRGLPPPHREPQHLRPGRAVHHQSCREAPEAGHLWAPLLLVSGVQCSSLLSGRHPGCPEGKSLLPEPPSLPSTEARVWRGGAHPETRYQCLCA